MFTIKLTNEERAILIVLLKAKAKEIHAWRIATDSQIRDAEYDRIAPLLKKIALMGEN